eukprot:232216-Chlamydomonas_euryale.AAC.1
MKFRLATLAALMAGLLHAVQWPHVAALMTGSQMWPGRGWLYGVQPACFSWLALRHGGRASSGPPNSVRRGEQQHARLGWTWQAWGCPCVACMPGLVGRGKHGVAHALHACPTAHSQACSCTCLPVLLCRQAGRQAGSDACTQ